MLLLWLTTPVHHTNWFVRFWDVFLLYTAINVRQQKLGCQLRCVLQKTQGQHDVLYETRSCFSIDISVQYKLVCRFWWYFLLNTPNTRPQKKNWAADSECVLVRTQDRHVRRTVVWYRSLDNNRCVFQIPPGVQRSWCSRITSTSPQQPLIAARRSKKLAA